MNTLKIKMIALFMATCFCTLAASASEEELKLEIVRLKQENKELREKLLKTQVQLSVAREKLADLNLVAKHNEDKVKKAGDTDKTVAMKDKKEEEEKKEIKPVAQKPVEFSSAMELINQMPDDAKPGITSGWVAFRKNKADKWLKEHGNDKQFRAELQVRTFKISRNLNPTDATKAWKISLSFEPRSHKYRIMHITEFVQPRSIDILCDEATVKQAQSKLGRGKVVEVTGKISSIQLQPFNPKSSYVHIWIENPSIVGFK